MHWLGPYEGFAGGGALFFYSSNTITVSSCSIEGNSNTGGFGMGGAMLFVSSNTITVSSCSIEGNSNTGGYGVGGAMYFRSSNPITLTSCSIESNSNIGGYGYGGALVFLQASNTITLINCSIEGNSITGGKGMGGAIYFSAANQISIALCTFANNIAGEGGAIYLDVTSTFIGMTSVFFSRNIALSGAGGAVYVGASSSCLVVPCPFLRRVKVCAIRPSTSMQTIKDIATPWYKNQRICMWLAIMWYSTMWGDQCQAVHMVPVVPLSVTTV